MDLANAYLQIPLDKQSKEYTTINIHKGLYCYNWLPFGVASTPSIFQHTMENILQGINHVCVYLDEILVTGVTDQEHLQNLNEVLSRLETADMRLKYDTCAFLLSAVEYLATKFQPRDCSLLMTRSKQSTMLLHQLMHLDQFKSFFGLANHHCKILPNLSNTLAPYTESFRKMPSGFGDPNRRKFFKQPKSL